MYKAVTRGISVTVTPRYMPKESSPEQGRYFFAYTVEIINTSLERVQLRARESRKLDHASISFRRFSKASPRR
jgi:ApaG protein